MSKKEEKFGLKGTAIIREVDPETGEVVSKEEAENLITDVGAIEIAKYINDEEPPQFEYMCIGSDGTAAGAGDTALGSQEDNEEVGEDSGSISRSTKTVSWTDVVFNSGSGKSSIEEMAMCQGSDSTADPILNRVTFSAKDNANNDLLITYELEVLSG